MDEWYSFYEGCKCKNENENSYNHSSNRDHDRQDTPLKLSHENYDNVYNNYRTRNLNDNHYEEIDKNTSNDASSLDNNNNKMCNSRNCTCIIVASNEQANYNEMGRLNVNDSTTINWFNKFIYPIIECNSECECNEKLCLNRIVQNGCKFKLEVFDCEIKMKGKGLRTKEFIPKGSFVVEYLGELIGFEEAELLYKIRSNLNEPNYIMFLKESYLNDNTIKTTIIDARNYSNIARFINHSCEPNLILLPVRIKNIIPHAALFAIRDINENEELSYDYNGSVGIHKINDNKNELLFENDSNKTECYCGSIKCLGILPNKI